MAVQITWQPSPNGPFELWLVEDDKPSCRFFAMAPNQMITARPLVQRWADQADSVPEFLEMMHLEDLIDLETLRHLLAEQIPLHRIWTQLREFCGEAGAIGEFPAQWIAIGTGAEGSPEVAVHLLESLAAQAAASAPQHIGPACYNPEVWEVYRPAIAVVVRALQVMN